MLTPQQQRDAKNGGRTGANATAFQVGAVVGKAAISAKAKAGATLTTAKAEAVGVGFGPLMAALAAGWLLHPIAFALLFGFFVYFSVELAAAADAYAYHLTMFAVFSGTTVLGLTFWAAAKHLAEGRPWSFWRGVVRLRGVRARGEQTHAKLTPSDVLAFAVSEIERTGRGVRSYDDGGNFAAEISGSYAAKIWRDCGYPAAAELTAADIEDFCGVVAADYAAVAVGGYVPAMTAEGWK